MSAAVVVVISVVAVGAVVWRARSAPAPASPRRRRLSIVRPERRRGDRLVPPSSKPAELQIMGQDFLEIPEVRDISETGIAISVPHKFNGHKPTKEVELLLTLHGQGTVRAKGSIRHVSYTRTDTATFGVELVAIDEKDRAKIRDYVANIREGSSEGVPTPIADEQDAHDDEGPAALPHRARR
jgi:hypothetical protein